MDVIHFPEDPRPSWWVHPVLALGNFDGLHRGHRKILDRVCRVASERGATTVVMTFDPHPPRVVRADKAPPLLMTKAQKIEAFADAGLQGAAIVRFTLEMSRWDPETFVRTVLVDWLRVSEVWVGANFLFGHDRTGNFSLLRTLGGGGVNIVGADVVEVLPDRDIAGITALLAAHVMFEILALSAVARTKHSR